MTLRTAIRRATERRRTARGFMPADQVLRAPQRPLVQHVHHRHRHQHLASTTLRLQVSVPVQVVSTTHPIRVDVVPTAAHAHPSTAYPGVVLRTLAPVAARTAAHPAAAAVAQVSSHGPRAASQTLTRPPLPARTGPARVELVHRRPTLSTVSSTVSSTGEWQAGARANATAQRAAWGPAAAGISTAPGAAPLTDADVPRVVDHVVRELDRRVVASRERRGWTT